MPVTARTGRMDTPRSFSRLLALAVLSALSLSPALALAQTEPATATAPAGAPIDLTRTSTPTTAAAPTPLLPPSAAATPPAHPTAAPAPAMEIGNVSQPFTGRITADRVYVRSGPGSAYYEMGQLSRGDTVEVVGSRLGWYQILPPNGTFCMVAKDFVETDPTGHTGTVKADYVNVRAGTALSKREPSAVLTVIRKGTRLDILGSSDKFYQVAPPEKAYVYISPQFVHQDAGAEYKVPTLKLPAGAVGPSRDTVIAPTTLPSATTPPASVEITPPTPSEATTPPAANISAAPIATTLPAATETIVVPPQPSPTFNGSAYDQFSDLNKRYQAELQKPPMQRDYESLITDYKSLAGGSNVPPSVAQGTESRITALEKLAAIQRLAKENAASTDARVAQQKALQEQYSQAEQAIADYEQTGPYLAQGRLQTSTAVEGKYALVNPASGRVVAYVDPQAAVDISIFVGKYIGVRGTTETSRTSNLSIIHVKNATLLPQPVVPTGTATH